MGLKVWNWVTALGVGGCALTCSVSLGSCGSSIRDGIECEENIVEARSESSGGGGVDLSSTPLGAVFVTWLEPVARSERIALRWGRRDSSQAVESVSLAGATILESERLFVNWADFPHVLALSESNAIVTYLERLGDGKYDYGVRFVCTQDAGRTWSEPRWLHDHVGPGEHGFVSLAREDDGTAVAVWLDGREMGEGEHGVTGAMTLRMRAVGVDGRLGPERLLDPRVCDCCQTDVATVEPGVWLVAYRDRSEDEVRDIKVLRVTANDLTPVFDSLDRFKFPGCPVNGPAIATRGHDAALVWFAPSVQGGGTVRVATSRDDGHTFSAVETLDDNAPSGRVEVCFDRCDETYSRPSHGYALWLGQGDGQPAWRYARFDPSLTGEQLVSSVSLGTLATTTGERDLGFPRAVADWHVFLAAYISADPERHIVLHRAGWYIP
ncbi:MAG: hypothetical protein HZA52_00625 [Planctomycetes bacterium]|nr:hypothetical protein [Planctomycetota bacterium]